MPRMHMSRYACRGHALRVRYRERVSRETEREERGKERERRGQGDLKRYVLLSLALS